VVQMAATEQTIYGGTCTLGAGCIANQTSLLGLSSTQWLLYRVPFAALAGGSTPFSPTQIWSIEFQPGVGSFDFWIDDLGFY